MRESVVERYKRDSEDHPDRCNWPFSHACAFLPESAIESAIGVWRSEDNTAQPTAAVSESGSGGRTRTYDQAVNSILLRSVESGDSAVESVVESAIAEAMADQWGDVMDLGLTA